MLTSCRLEALGVSIESSRKEGMGLGRALEVGLHRTLFWGVLFERLHAIETQRRVRMFDC